MRTFFDSHLIQDSHLYLLSFFLYKCKSKTGCCMFEISAFNIEIAVLIASLNSCRVQLMDLQIDPCLKDACIHQALHVIHCAFWSTYLNLWRSLIIAHCLEQADYARDMVSVPMAYKYLCHLCPFDLCQIHLPLCAFSAVK